MVQALNECAKRGHFEKARQILQRSRGSIGPETQSVVDLKDQLLHIGRKGSEEDVRSVLRELRAAGVHPSTEVYSSIFDRFVYIPIVLEDMCRRGDFRGALPVLRGAVDQGTQLEPSLLGRLRELVLEKGTSAEAQRLLGLVHDGRIHADLEQHRDADSGRKAEGGVQFRKEELGGLRSREEAGTDPYQEPAEGTRSLEESSGHKGHMNGEEKRHGMVDAGVGGFTENGREAEGISSPDPMQASPENQAVLPQQISTKEQVPPSGQVPPVEQVSPREQPPDLSRNLGTSRVDSIAEGPAVDSIANKDDTPQANPPSKIDPDARTDELVDRILLENHEGGRQRSTRHSMRFDTFSATVEALLERDREDDLRCLVVSLPSRFVQEWVVEELAHSRFSSSFPRILESLAASSCTVSRDTLERLARGLVQREDWQNLVHAWRTLCDKNLGSSALLQFLLRTGKKPSEQVVRRLKLQIDGRGGLSSASPFPKSSKETAEDGVATSFEAGGDSGLDRPSLQDRALSDDLQGMLARMYDADTPVDTEACNDMLGRLLQQEGSASSDQMRSVDSTDTSMAAQVDGKATQRLAALLHSDDTCVEEEKFEVNDGAQVEAEVEDDVYSTLRAVLASSESMIMDVDHEASSRAPCSSGGAGYAEKAEAESAAEASWDQVDRMTTTAGHNEGTVVPRLQRVEAGDENRRRRRGVRGYHTMTATQNGDAPVGGSMLPVDRAVGDASASPSVIGRNLSTSTPGAGGSTGSTRTNYTYVQSAVLERYRKSGRVPNPQNVMKVIEAAVKHGDVDSAISAITELLDLGARLALREFIPLVSICAKRGDHEGAQEVFQVMRAARVRPNLRAYNCLLSSYCRGSDATALQGALGVLAELQRDGFSPDVCSYSPLIEAYARRGALAEMDLMYETLKQSGVVPDTPLYTAAISGLVASIQSNKSNKHKQAVRRRIETFLGEMAHYKLEADAGFFQAVAGASAEVDQAQGQAARVQRLEKAVLQLCGQGLRPPPEVMNSVITLYVKQHHFQEAWEAVKAMSTAGLSPTIASYNILLKGCGLRAYANRPIRLSASDVAGQARGRKKEHSEVEMAEFLMDRLEGEGLAPDERTFTSLLKIYASSGDVKGMRRVRQRMDVAGVRPNKFTFNVMLSCLANAGDAAAASEILTEMEAQKVRADEVTYSTLLNAHAKGGDSRAALQVFHRMKALKLKPGTVAYTTLMNLYVSRQDIEGIRMVLQLIREDGLDPFDIRPIRRTLAKTYPGDVRRLMKALGDDGPRGRRGFSAKKQSEHEDET